MPYKIWINGTYTVGSSANVIEVRNPATEEIVDTAPAANAADVDAAVSAAQAAFPAWKKVPAGQKAEMLHEVAQKLTERTEEFARLLTLEGGKPFVENRDEMGWSAACFRYYAEIGPLAWHEIAIGREITRLSMNNLFDGCVGFACGCFVGIPSRLIVGLVH